MLCFLSLFTITNDCCLVTVILDIMYPTWGDRIICYLYQDTWGGKGKATNNCAETGSKIRTITFPTAPFVATLPPPLCAPSPSLRLNKSERRHRQRCDFPQPLNGVLGSKPRCDHLNANT